MTAAGASGLGAREPRRGARLARLQNLAPARKEDFHFALLRHGNERHLPEAHRVAREVGLLGHLSYPASGNTFATLFFTGGTVRR